MSKYILLNKSCAIAPPLAHQQPRPVNSPGSSEVKAYLTKLGGDPGSSAIQARQLS